MNEKENNNRSEAEIAGLDTSKPSGKLTRINTDKMVGEIRFLTF
jgi:hypothetical protein